MNRKEYKHIIRSSKWQRVRKEYFAEHPACEICGAKGKVLDVHHRVPIQRALSVGAIKYLSYSMDNLMTLCRACHRAKHRIISPGAMFQKKGRGRG